MHIDDKSVFMFNVFHIYNVRPFMVGCKTLYIVINAPIGYSF